MRAFLCSVADALDKAAKNNKNNKNFDKKMGRISEPTRTVSRHTVKYGVDGIGRIQML